MPSSTLVSLCAGLLFGLALAAPPGPMNAIIAEESVVRGWFAGVATGLGAMAADAIFLVLALAGVATVVEELPTLRGTMVTLGGFLMLYFALDAARSAGESLTAHGAIEAESRGFRKALVLGLTNPFQILFWLTVGVGLLEPGTVDVLAHTPYVGEAAAGLVVVETGSVALLAGLFAGIVLWITAFPALLVATNRRVDSLAPVVAGVSALLLTAFGVVFLWDGIGSLR